MKCDRAFSTGAHPGPFAQHHGVHHVCGPPFGTVVWLSSSMSSETHPFRISAVQKLPNSPNEAATSVIGKSQQVKKNTRNAGRHILELYGKLIYIKALLRFIPCREIYEFTLTEKIVMIVG